jgi:hypothetical protein
MGEQLWLRMKDTKPGSAFVFINWTYSAFWLKYLLRMMVLLALKVLTLSFIEHLQSFNDVLAKYYNTQSWLRVHITPQFYILYHIFNQKASFFCLGILGISLIDLSLLLFLRILTKRNRFTGIIYHLLLGIWGRSGCWSWLWGRDALY